MASLAAIGAIAGLASSGLSAYGTLAGGRASARASQMQARAESDAIKASSTAQGVQALMSATAQVGGLLRNIPLIKMRAENEKLAGEVESRALDMQAGEELAQSSVNAREIRRRKNLELSSLTNRAAASGFTADDTTASRISDEIERYGEMQAGMEMYGGLSRSDALRDAAIARRHFGTSSYLAGLMEADAAREAGLDILDSGRYVSDITMRTGRIASQNAITAGNVEASATRRASTLGAAGTLIGGISTFASNYDKTRSRQRATA